MKRIRMFSLLLVAVILVGQTPSLAQQPLKKPLPFAFSNDAQPFTAYWGDPISRTDNQIKIVMYDSDVIVKNGYANVFPAKGNAFLVDTADVYGNLNLFCHSGYDSKKALLCEPIRNYLEGGNIRDIWTRNKPDVVKQRAKSLVGTYIMLQQGDQFVLFKVAAIFNVSHARLPEYDADTATVLDKLVNWEIADEGVSKFAIAQSDPRQYVLLSFCGWIQPNQPEWWDGTKWIVLLEPVL